MPFCPRIAKPIAKAIATLTDRIKGIERHDTERNSPEVACLKLLLAYHQSLRHRGLFLKSTPFNFEKANPFARYTPNKLGYYHLAMMVLYTLKPYGQRLLRYNPPSQQTPDDSADNFFPYSAHFAQLPFINFTPLCLVSPEIGCFYIYPTLILHYPPDAPLHEPTILSLRQGQIDCNVIPNPNANSPESGAIVQISFAANALTLQFDFSPWAIKAFSFLQKHCITLNLPIVPKSILFSSSNTNGKVFQLVDYIGKGIFALPTLADNLEINLYEAALTLTEAYRVNWYSADRLGTPYFKPLSNIEYLHTALAHYSVDPEHLDNNSLFAQLSSEYFTASLLYVERLFQLANAALTPAHSFENRAEGVLLDLLRIAFSIEGYYPKRDLVSVPIMQALFMTFLPNVPLSMRTFKLAYNKWPYALLITLSIFKRQDYLQQFYDTEFLTVKYAALASSNDAHFATLTLQRIAELMFSCCELKTQQNSYEFFRLKAQLNISRRTALSFNGFRPALFELTKLADPSSSQQLIGALINLPTLKTTAMPTAPQRLPLLLFIFANYKGTLPFIFYETALRHAQLPGNSFRLAQCSVSLNRTNLQALANAFDRAATGILVLNVAPLTNTFNKDNISATKRRVAQLIANKPPKVIFVTFIGLPPDQRIVATEMMKNILYPPFIVCQHTAMMRNYSYIFQRLAALFEINITHDAIQAVVTRLGKSKRSQALLLAHPVPVLLSLFRRALLAHAQRQAECLRNPHADPTKAITAEDILNIKLNKSTL